MKLTATEDISAPIERVFEQLCDPDRLERTVRRKGGWIRRTPAGPLQHGTRWEAKLAFRGATREVSFQLSEFRPPEILRFEGCGAAIDLWVDVELTALSPATTRLSVTTQGAPKNLAGRVMMQSLKLARGRILTRYRQRVSDYATAIEKTNRLG